MKKPMLSSLVLALVLPFMSGHGQEPGSKAGGLVRAVMQQKLQHSQKVLEGVATDNLKLVARHADDLIQLSKRIEWMVYKTPQYEMFSNEFRRNAENLVRQARDQNLDGCALSYVEMTLTCVRCHKYVREVRTTRRDGDPQEVPEPAFPIRQVKHGASEGQGRLE